MSHYCQPSNRFRLHVDLDGNLVTGQTAVCYCGLEIVYLGWYNDTTGREYDPNELYWYERTLIKEWP